MRAQCKSFEQCIQPHICDATKACIWGQESKMIKDTVEPLEYKRIDSTHEVEYEDNQKIIISNRFTADNGKIKRNDLKVNRLDNGEYQLYVMNGKTEDGKKKYGRIRLSKEILDYLKKWVDNGIGT